MDADELEEAFSEAMLTTFGDEVYVDKSPNGELVVDGYLDRTLLKNMLFELFESHTNKVV